MNESQQNKIKQLRAKYFSDDDKPIIDGLEKDLARIMEEKRMAENPVFQAIFGAAEKKLNEITALIDSDEALTDIARAALFHERRVWRYVLSSFGLKPHDNALALLESTLDSKLGM
jgi:hypothetical protein